MHLNSIIILGFVLANQLNGEPLKNAQNDQFPSLVALLDLKMNYVAPASLITTYHVFSAASWHVPGKALMALAGDISLSRTARKNRQIRSIVKITVHPEFEDTKDPNFDVAICLVSKPFKMMLGVQPNLICGYPPNVGEFCTSIGWGLLSSDSSIRTPNSNTSVDNIDSSLSIEPSNVLLYQEFEIALKRDCDEIVRTQGICGREYSEYRNEKLAIEFGGPVICSNMLCGIFINNPRLDISTVSFSMMKPFLDWIDKEIALQSQDISYQYYIKRSHAEKKDYLSLWIRCLEILKLLMYFI